MSIVKSSSPNLVFETNCGLLRLFIDVEPRRGYYVLYYRCECDGIEMTGYVGPNCYERDSGETVYTDLLIELAQLFHECIGRGSQDRIRQYYETRGIIIGAPRKDLWDVNGKRWNELTQEEKDHFRTEEEFDLPRTPYEKQLATEIEHPVYDNIDLRPTGLYSRPNILDHIFSAHSRREWMHKQIEKEKQAAAREGRLTWWDDPATPGWKHSGDPSPDELTRTIDANDSTAKSYLNNIREWRRNHEAKYGPYIKPAPQSPPKNYPQKEKGIFDFLDDLFG